MNVVITILKLDLDLSINIKPIEAASLELIDYCIVSL